MELHQLRAFIAIAKKSSLARASEALHISQSAVSAKIKGLEQELGIVLFDRSAQGMILTKAGQVLLDEAVHAVAAASGVINRATSLRDGAVTTHFTLGTITEPAILRLSTFSAEIFSRYPSIRISLQQGASGQVIDKVLSEQYDAGYVIGPVEYPSLLAIPVAPVALKVVAPVAWRDKMIGADWVAMAHMPWIGTPAHCSFNRIAQNMFQRQGLTPKFIMEADQEVTLKDLVTAEVGITLLREDIALAAEMSGQLVIWPGTTETSMIHFLYPKLKSNTVVMRAVIDTVRDVWRL